MLRVMTVNLFNDRSHHGHLAEVLDSHRPDLLLCQELGPSAASVIEERFEWASLHPGLDYLGWGIASRLPARFGGTSPWGRGGTALLDWGGSLHVANVHIVDPLHRPLRETQATRRRQLEAVVSWASEIPGDSPILIGGDLNASPAWGVYRRLTKVFDDLAEQGSPGRAAATWGIPGRGLKMLRIDHVLGRGLRATATNVVTVRGSDHAALIVDLEVSGD